MRMVSARLTEIPRNEVLHYLGYPGGPLEEQIETELNQCRELILKTARPRLTYKICALDADKMPQGILFRPEGKDIRALLDESRRVVLFAATLGNEVEQLLRRKQVQNMADALILDSCASAAIENVCDNFCADLQGELSNTYLTDRFSPGYGDFPFTQQRELCAVLDIGRKIGVSLSDSGLMIPQKSVTALIGIADRPQKKRFRGCAVCSMFENCAYRKEKKSCGRE